MVVSVLENLFQMECENLTRDFVPKLPRLTIVQLASGVFFLEAANGVAVARYWYKFLQ